MKGRGNRRTKHFGTGQGSLAVEIAGPKRGIWYDFDGLGQGGDLLSLIRHIRGGTFHDAVAYATHWLGIDIDAAAGAPDPDVEARRETERADRKRRADAQAAQDAAKRVQAARWWWAQRKPLSGTPGAVYLASRGIAEPAGGWPDALAWLAAREVMLTEEGPDGAEVRRRVPCAGAVMAAATDEHGDVMATHRIYVDHAGQVIRDASGRKLKLTRGVLADTRAVVRIPGATDQPLLLAEGIETGLSIAAAGLGEVWIGLGGLANQRPPSGRRVAACRDDDKPQSPADKALSRSLAEWKNNGANVVVAYPWADRRGDRSDFNDTLQSGGIDAVRARLLFALNPGPDGDVPHRLPVAEARARLTDAVGQFFDAAAAWDAPIQTDVAAARVKAVADGLKRRDLVDAIKAAKAEAIAAAGAPPVHAIRVGVGLGKSTEARRQVAALLRRMREAGDQRTVVITVPTVALGDEQAAAFSALSDAQAAGLTARVWRGRDRDDPDAPGETMCRDLDAVKDAQAAMASVQTSVCQQRRDGVVLACPFAEVCGYQRQRSASADVWFAAHEMLFSPAPKALGEVALLIVDEGMWDAGLQGVDARPIRMAAEALEHNFDIPDDRLSTARLGFLRGRLIEAVASLADGEALTREALLSAHFPVGVTKEAQALEWMRKQSVDIFPGMPAADRREIARAAQINRGIPRYNMIWRAVGVLASADGPAASGWVRAGTIETDNGPTRVLTLRGRKPIHADWLVPTVLLDATLRIELVRPYWPGVILIADVAAEAAHMRVRQVGDRTYSRQRLDGAAALREAHAIICREARRHAPGRVLSVMQAGVEFAVAKRGHMPVNLTTGHHNALAGRDEWRDVAGLIVVGRTAPPPWDVERIAEALTGAEIEPAGAWYPAADAWREMADGTFRPAKADRHPDPTAEAVRWSICEGELVQIVGRARGVNRSAADPVDVLLMVNTPLPVPVAEMLAADDLAPSPADLMLAAGGVAFSNASDAATAYPDLWATREAAKKALARWQPRLGTSPIRYSLMENVPNLSTIGYLKAGSGARRAIAVYDPVLVPDPVGWLTERLGPLAWHDGPEHPPDPPGSRAPDLSAPQPDEQLPDIEVSTMPDDSVPDPHASVPPPDPSIPFAVVTGWPRGRLVITDIFRLSDGGKVVIADGRMQHSAPSRMAGSTEHLTRLLASVAPLAPTMPPGIVQSPTNH